MSEPILNGLMMDDYPLSLTAIVERAEALTGGRKVVSRRPDGSIHRTTLGECAARARRLASALAELGIGDGDRVATLLWNQPEHLELYFAVPAMGAVIHTLNPRLHPDELGFIASDAEDRAIVVDESLLAAFEAFQSTHEFEHVIVVSHGDPARLVPDGAIDYESLIAGAEPIDGPSPNERRAAAICYTSGTTGRPKGVLYSHRALVLHSLAAALPDAIDISTRDTVLPVVPMFHANAWGLPYTAAFVGRGAGAARAAARCGERARSARRRAGHDHRRRADRVDGDAQGARRRARALGPGRAASPARRRLGGAQEPDRGLRPARPRRSSRRGG